MLFIFCCIGKSVFGEILKSWVAPKRKNPHVRISRLFGLLLARELEGILILFYICIWYENLFFSFLLIALCCCLARLCLILLSVIIEFEEKIEDGEFKKHFLNSLYKADNDISDDGYKYDVVLEVLYMLYRKWT